MKIKKQIEDWKKSGLINADQAQKMLVDVESKSTDERSNKFIVAVSTIGSILLGIGAILFIASNWEEMSDGAKIAVLAVSTFGAYYLGYLFKYEKRNLPKVGASLFFLGALLFGASIFLIAQIYNIEANSHVLVLVWLIGVLPLVYAFKSESIAALSAILFLVWSGLFLFRGFWFDEDIIFSFPVIYLSCGALLFAIGGLHYASQHMQKIGRIFRVIGLKAAMLSLFLLTFDAFSGDHTWGRSSFQKMLEHVHGQLVWGIAFISIVAIVLILVNIRRNFSNSKTNLIENSTVLGLLLFTLLFFFNSPGSGLYLVAYNLIFAALTLLLIYIGYERSDISIVNVGIFWLAIFIFAKYFDFFWDLMDRSLFFLLGGIVLVAGAVVLETKRRRLKERFLHVEQTNA